MYVCCYVFLKFVEACICFNESSILVTEDRGLAILLLNLTNPSSTDIITVITTDGITTGKVNTIVHIIIIISIHLHYLASFGYMYQVLSYIVIASLNKIHIHIL